MAFVGKKTWSPDDVLSASDMNSLVTQTGAFLGTATTSTAYTVGSADAWKTLRFTNSTASVVTVGTAAGMAVNDRFDVFRDGGTVTLVFGSGISAAANGTARTAGTFTLGTQYTGASVWYVDTNAYRIIGQVS
jgi:hypothetical protein